MAFTEHLSFLVSVSSADKSSVGASFMILGNVVGKSSHLSVTLKGGS